MSTKRTHGPCTCIEAYTRIKSHHPDCPSLYPTQQESNALTRLVRHIRSSTLHEVEMDEALTLISDAREEQRKARNHGWNDGIEEAGRILEAVFDQPTMAADVRAKKVTP